MKLVCQKEQEAPSSGIIIIVFSSLGQCGPSKKFWPPKRGDDDGKFLYHAALKKCRFFSPPYIHGEREETAAVFPHFPFSSEEALFLSAHHPLLLPLIYTRELSCFQIYCCRRKWRGKRGRRVPAPSPPPPLRPPPMQKWTGKVDSLPHAKPRGEFNNLAIKVDFLYIKKFADWEIRVSALTATDL